MHFFTATSFASREHFRDTIKFIDKPPLSATTDSIYNKPGKLSIGTWFRHIAPSSTTTTRLKSGHWLCPRDDENDTTYKYMYKKRQQRGHLYENPGFLAPMNKSFCKTAASTYSLDRVLSYYYSSYYSSVRSSRRSVAVSKCGRVRC